MSSCVFCLIAAGVEAPAGPDPTIHRIGSCTVFTPFAPVVPGHVLVVPSSHVPDAEAQPAITGLVFQAAAEWASRFVRPFNLITSAGREATQTVYHLHVHYVPRAVGDGLPLPWTPQLAGSG